ncbi:MAG TPA: DUF5723 family protein [Bacteroidales bacterium]|nr:DUF5723 family protein [Bacteroidales bacterium]
MTRYLRGWILSFPKLVALLILTGMIAGSPDVDGQDKTGYLLDEVPQAINLNPAVWYSCRNFVALPGMSDLGFSYRNNGFSYNQAITTRSEMSGDSILLNPGMLSSVLANMNNVRIGTELALFGFGFRYADWYFSVYATNRSSTGITFARDIVDARDGNWDLATNKPRQINLNGTGFHFINFTELAFGGSKKIYDGLYIGGRLKFLMGAGHLQTLNSKLSLTTTASPIELSGTSSFRLIGSLPVDVTVNNDGLVTNVGSPVNSFTDVPRYLLSGNLGLALDAGIIYAYTDRLTLSASINDLGFIRWRRNTSVLEQSGHFVFSGLDLNSYVRGGTDTDLLQALQDSIVSNFRLSQSNDPYIALIPARIFAGAEYELNRALSLGTVAELEMLNGRLYPGMTFMGVARPVEGLTLSLSYSLMDRAFDDIGFAIIAGKKYIQFYFITDHIPVRYVSDRYSGFKWPYSARTMNFRMGINVFLGCLKDKRPGYRHPGRNKLCPAYR